MGHVTIAALKVVIALSLAGSVVVQAVLLPLAWADLVEAGVPPWGRLALISIAGAGVLTMQVFAICVWRLLTLVRRGSVFSPAAFGYLHAIIGAFVAAAVLAFALAITLAPGGMAPGLIALICGASLVLAGIALLGLVVRRLLVQAIDTQSEVRALRTELDAVV